MLLPSLIFARCVVSSPRIGHFCFYFAAASRFSIHRSSVLTEYRKPREPTRTDRKSPRGNVSPHKVLSLMPSVSAASRAERRSFSLGGLVVVMWQPPLGLSSMKL
jgi:hypothetical protein